MFELFTFDFIIYAFLVGIVLAIIVPSVGTFLVVRRYAALGDTLAHVSLVGVAVSFLTHTQPIISTLLVTTGAALGIEYLRRSKKIAGEALLMIFLSGSLGVATVLMGLAKGFNATLFNFLFGSITTISKIDVYVTFSVGLVVSLVLFLFYKELFLISFDEELAHASGVKTKMLNMLFMCIAAVTVTLAMRIVGGLLVGSLMVIPVIAAMQFQKSFRRTVFIAILCALIAVIAGLFASYYFDLASGGTIVIVLLLLFFISLILNRNAKN